MADAATPDLSTRDYAFMESVNEVLTEAKDQLDMARNSDGVKRIAMRLRMAHRAIECALEFCGDYAANKEKT